MFAATGATTTGATTTRAVVVAGALPPPSPLSSNFPDTAPTHGRFTPRHPLLAPPSLPPPVGRYFYVYTYR